LVEPSVELSTASSARVGVCAASPLAVDRPLHLSLGAFWRAFSACRLTPTTCSASAWGEVDAKQWGSSCCCSRGRRGNKAREGVCVVIEKAKGWKRSEISRQPSHSTNDDVMTGPPTRHRPLNRWESSQPNSDPITFGKPLTNHHRHHGRQVFLDKGQRNQY